MQDKRYIICGNAPTDGIKENPDRDLRLRLWGKDGPDKITLRIEDIHKKMSKDVPDSFQDLLEIATYVYSADQAIPRGADDVDSFSHGWRRDLHFIIPVRKPDFWNRDDIHQALRSTEREGEKIDWLCIEGARMKRLREEVVNNIREIIGKWPGNETDAEFDELMREHEERD